MQLPDLAGYFDGLLRTAEVPDYPNAFNGLQVETDTSVSRVAFAVDASRASIEEAVRLEAQLLVVHHGLFWDGQQPVTGRRYRRIKALLDGGLGLYSSHLPLDIHPELGNNVVLARKAGIEPEGRFGDFKGMPVGVWGRLEIRREALAARLDEILGCRVRMVPGGPERLTRVGVVTGGAANQLEAAKQAGLDALITGEGAHHHFFDAMEGGVNLFLGGHYATEVWGIRALAEHVADKLGLETIFIDQPTGF